MVNFITFAYFLPTKNMNISCLLEALSSPWVQHATAREATSFGQWCALQTCCECGVSQDEPIFTEPLVFLSWEPQWMNGQSNMWQVLPKTRCHDKLQIDVPGLYRLRRWKMDEHCMFSLHRHGGLLHSIWLLTDVPWCQCTFRKRSGSHLCFSI